MLSDVGQCWAMLGNVEQCWQLLDITKAAARLCVPAIPCVTLLREALVYFLTAKAAFFSIFHALSEKSVENA